LGAIVSPAVSGWLMAAYGPYSMFAFISLAHLLLLLFGIWRATRRPSSTTRVPYRYLPRTTLFVGGFLRRRRHKPSADDSQI